MTQEILYLRTLVALPSALEEVLRCLPALDAMAASGRRLLALAEADAIPLLRLADARPEPLPRLDDLNPTRSVILAAGCQEAVILSGRLDDAWLARSAGIAQRWGYRSAATSWFLNRRVRRPSRRLRAVRCVTEDPRELLEAMDVPWLSATPKLTLGADLRGKARERLERAHLEVGGGPILGVYPGVRGGAGRPWPRRRFEELVRQLRRLHPAFHFVLLATTADLWTAVRIHEETGKIHPVIGPDLGLDALAAVLAELDAVVAVESSMLDLAAAAGTHTFGLHSRDPRRWAPPSGCHRAIQAKEGTIGAIRLEQVIEAMAPLARRRDGPG